MEKSEVANRIKELREAKKMTQNALANAAVSLRHTFIN